MLFALLLSLAACGEQDKIPEDALLYSVTVTGIGPDECHPGNTEGYQETFDYAVAFSAAQADIFLDGEPFATGTLTGCNLSYQTVVLGTDGRTGGELKWQITGTAKIDAGDDACVEGDNDFEGTETIEVVGSEDDAIEVGCTYPMSVAGVYTGIETD